jgi:hypothetical protein
MFMLSVVVVFPPQLLCVILPIRKISAAVCQRFAPAVYQVALCTPFWLDPLVLGRFDLTGLGRLMMCVSGGSIQLLASMDGTL